MFIRIRKKALQVMIATSIVLSVPVSITLSTITNVVYAADTVTFNKTPYELDSSGLTNLLSAIDGSDSTVKNAFYNALTGGQASSSSSSNLKINDLFYTSGQVASAVNSAQSALDVLNSTLDVNASDEAKQKVNQIEGFDVAADITGATVALDGTRDIITTITGILCYAVVIGLPLFTGIDICYISFPLFREKANNAASSASGNGAFTNTSKSTGQTKLRIITDEAVYAVEQQDLGNGKRALSMYLKSRIITYILVAIVIYILLTGRVSMIVNFALNIIQGIITTLKRLSA